MLELPKGKINFYQLKKRNKWTLEEMLKFKAMINNKNENEVNEILTTIYDYGLSFDQISSLNINLLHKEGLRLLINQKSSIQDLNILLKEHSEILKTKELPIPSQNDDLNTLNLLRNIQNNSLKYSGQKINKNNIDQELKNNDENLIAIVYNAVKEINNFLLNNCQLLALLLLLNKKNNKGKILQMLTGEGKSIIINCFAIIMVLKDHKFDFVTSNPILVKERF